MMIPKRTRLGLYTLLSVLVLAFSITIPVHAQAPAAVAGFALQVTPSPLVATVKPGEQTSLELRIRNTSSSTQALKMGTRSFSVNESTGQVDLSNDEARNVSRFIQFEQPTFTLRAGEIFTQHILVNTPKDAGFTYSFAITVSRQSEQKPQSGSTAIEGSIAVFTLLSVDKPGAVRKFELGEFSSKKHVYEYLPASFDLKLKNTGNTLVQPKGNIYIQRKSSDTQPISSLPLNVGGGYILPNSNRVLSTNWDSGFPRYEHITDESGKQSNKLKWNFNNLSNFRIGRYTAKVVAVYDDGQRDVPITSEITFWVLPWRILLGSFVVLLLVLLGFYSLFRRSLKIIKKKPVKKSQSDEKP